MFFSNNDLKEIPEDLLKNNPEIVSVDFSRNKVGHISKNTFRSNHMIVKASLARNRIIKVWTVIVGLYMKNVCLF